MPCANCRKDVVNIGAGDCLDEDELTLSLGLGTRSDPLGDQDDNKIPITTAIMTIFEANLQLYKKQIPPACKLKMCPDCSSSLTALYEAFVRFMGFTTEGSYMQRLILKSSIWTFVGAETNSDYDFSLSSSLVDVKLEEGDRDDIDLDLGQIKEENEDPDFTYNENFAHGREQYHFLRRSTRKQRVTSKSSRRALVSPLSLSLKALAARKPSVGVKCQPGSRMRKSKPRELKVPVKRKTDSEVKLFRCPEADCTKSFNCGKLLRRHVKFRHGGATPEELLVRTCNLCPTPRIFCTPAELRIHQQEVHATENPFDCSQCDRHFPSKNRLRIHVLVAHIRKEAADSQNRKEKEIHLCHHNCQIPFPSRMSLKLHLKAVHDEVLCYTCAECGRTFHGHRAYGRHLKYKHGVGLKESEIEGKTCTLCPNSTRIFETKSQLRVHIASVHATEKPFECPVEGCGRKFPTKNYLDIHYHQRHKEGRLQYPCDTCGKTFGSKSHLQEHVRAVHLGEKNVVCDVCGKSFARQSDLTRHAELHDPTRVKRWECTICRKLFISESNLRKHAITHSGSRDQSCDQCGLTFIHVASLRRHLNAIHGIRPASGVDSKEPHSCEQCGKTFKLKEYLRQHLRSRTHGGKGHTAQRKKETD